MAIFHPEKRFERIFNARDVYFKEKIVENGWECLMHKENNAFNFYTPTLVEEFYNGILDDTIDLVHDKFKFEWRDNTHVFDKHLISAITGIPVGVGSLIGLPMEDYLPLMGHSCVNPRMGGIKGTSMYKNVYATCKWLCYNVMGTSQTNTFYTPTLHAVHSLMFTNYNYCMCKQLLHNIANHWTKVVQGLGVQEGTPLILPCFITQILSQFVSEQEFQSRPRVEIEEETLARGYNLCDIRDWTPEMGTEDITASMVDADFWNQPNIVDFPEGMSEYMDFTQTAMKNLHIRMENLEKGESSSKSRKRRG